MSGCGVSRCARRSLRREGRRDMGMPILGLRWGRSCRSRGIEDMPSSPSKHDLFIDISRLGLTVFYVLAPASSHLSPLRPLTAVTPLYPTPPPALRHGHGHLTFGSIRSCPRGPSISLALVAVTVFLERPDSTHHLSPTSSDSDWFLIYHAWFAPLRTAIAAAGVSPQRRTRCYCCTERCIQACLSYLIPMTEHLSYPLN